MFNICNKASATLWYARPGHIPMFVLKQLPLNVEVSLDSYCDVCHLSKQTRFPFQFSISHSIAKFELIHCDIWGPYKRHTHGKCSQFLTIVDDFSKMYLGFSLS